jgi:TrmH family RNA methyltransferase
MNGENIYNATIPQNGVLVMGNEGQGISDRINANIKKNISIPAYGTPAAESLNVAIATGIILAEFSRRG